MPKTADFDVPASEERFGTHWSRMRGSLKEKLISPKDAEESLPHAESYRHSVRSKSASSS